MVKVAWRKLRMHDEIQKIQSATNVDGKRSLNFEGVFKNFFTADLSSDPQSWPNWGTEPSAGLAESADNSIKLSILHQQNFLIYLEGHVIKPNLSSAKRQSGHYGFWNGLPHFHFVLW